MDRSRFRLPASVIVCVIVTIAGLFPCVPASAGTGLESLLGTLGDVDTSGAVNALDIQLVLNGALGIPSDGMADIDISGAVDAIDVQLVINAALGLVIGGGSVIATVDTLAGPPPLTVQFTASVSDLKFGALRYYWSFADGANSTEANPLHTFLEGAPLGEYRCIVTVTDDQGMLARAGALVTITAGRVGAAEEATPGTETVVRVQDPADPLGPASVTIPGAALKAPAIITIGEADAAPLVPFGTTPLLELGPDGAVFDEPVTVLVPVPGSVNNPEAITLVAFDPQLGQWVDDGLSNVAYLGGPNRLLKFDTRHFSFFAVSATWTISQIPTLGGVQNFGFAINNGGRVAGYSYVFVAANWRQAFRWDSTAGSVGLASVDKYSYAFGINDANPVQVVGYSQLEGYSTDYKALLWDATNGVQDLGHLGGASAIARAINDSGEVAGFSTNGAGNTRAFLWDATNGIQDLGTLGGSSSMALGINDLGEVVGNSQRAAETKVDAFIWNSTNGMRSLGGFHSAKYGVAFDINESSKVAGQAETQPGPNHAALWSGNSITDLGVLGGTESVAYAINDSSQVVGASDTVSGVQHAFGWDNVGGSPVMTDLNDLLPAGSGWVLEQARDINNTGVIVGWGTYGSEIRTYILQKQ